MRELVIEFDDNAVLQLLVGELGSNLAKISAVINMPIKHKGNRLIIKGDLENLDEAKEFIESLCTHISSGKDLNWEELSRKDNPKQPMIITPMAYVKPASAGQSFYINSIARHSLTFAIGPAGTGKTYLAVAMAVSALVKGLVDRIILSRPAVEAGEKLGFLPGDLKEKVDPYLRPLYDSLVNLMGFETMEKHIKNGQIEIAPLAFMRGRTLDNAFVILDEAQNTTPTQMKMFLTRLGKHSKMVVVGDLTQVDLPASTISGLRDAVHVLDEINDISIVHLTGSDIVRSDLVALIIEAYNKKD